MSISVATATSADQAPSEDLMALDAPMSSRCDLCRVPFCGIGVHDRCVARSLLAQQPEGLADVGDLVQAPAVYAAFDGNGHEVELLLDHLTHTRTAPRDVYRAVVRALLASPKGLAPLLDAGLFPDAAPDAPRTRVCRACAADVLLWGLRAWWVRERAYGAGPDGRPDCPDGRACPRQGDLAHAKECACGGGGPMALVSCLMAQATTSSRNPRTTFRPRQTLRIPRATHRCAQTRPPSSPPWSAALIRVARSTATPAMIIRGRRIALHRSYSFVLLPCLSAATGMSSPCFSPYLSLPGRWIDSSFNVSAHVRSLSSLWNNAFLHPLRLFFFASAPGAAARGCSSDVPPMAV
jgi:hypothetical protein